MKRSKRDEEVYKMHYPQPGDRRAELYQNAEPPLRQKLDWIQEWWEREYRHHALSLYELGRQCKEVYDDVAKHRGRRYGSGAVDVIEEYFGFDENLIYRSLKLANAFTEEEIKEATAVCKANGEPVSIRDLLVLARLKDAVLRKELLAQAVAQGWSSEELNYAVSQAVGPEESEKPDGRGRPLAVPRNLDDVLRQQERAAKDFVNRAVNVWEKPGSSLESMAVNVAADEYTEERAEKLKAHVALMDQLAQEARERADEARQVYERFIEILSRRQQPTSEGNSPEEEAVPPPLGPGLPTGQRKGKVARGKHKAEESENDAGS